MLGPLLDASRRTKRAVSVAYDITALSFSLYIAWALRLGHFSIAPTRIDLVCLGVTIAVSIIAFIRLGLYRAILRYMAQDAAVSIGIGLIISSVTLAASSFFLTGSIPRSVPIIYLLTASFLIGFPRLMLRNVVQMLFPTGDTKVLIYGAGSAGRMLAESLTQSQKYQPVAFLDDDVRFVGSRIRGLQVHAGTDAGQLLQKHQCKKIFLALGAVDRATKLNIIRRLEKFPIQIQTIPPLEDLTNGVANISEIRDIQIEDLLGRDPVQPDETLMRANTHNKVVMVTGAGGSIGSELCRQILKCRPEVLILFELNEYNLYQIDEELQETQINLRLGTKLVPLLGSVQDKNRLKSIMQHFGVQTVYHAAAYKHVPLVERNMIEGIRNNVFGTYYCALAAQTAQVETFVLISTDKAVRSTNIMGASKRMAEMTVQLVSETASVTRFSVVRFGNVLGSSGSVVPKFRKQIEAGGPITVTHPDITRYFMTIPEASQLVIQAGAMAKGGSTYVLEMGEPVKIADLAKEMIRLSGYKLKTPDTPRGDLEIIYTGLRPGEKLYEELLISDNVIGTQHPRITEAVERTLNKEEIAELVAQLESSCESYDCQAIADLLGAIPDTYTCAREPGDALFIGERGRNAGEKPQLQIVTK
jgi:FlaA1/EpsC-like NDP-sugar epimerase